MLEVFTYAVEQHYAHCFRIFLYDNSTDRSNTHQKVFIKYMAFCQVAQCSEYDPSAKQNIG